MATNKDNIRKYVNLTNETMSNVKEFNSLNNNTDFNTKICEITDTFSAMINFCKRELYQYFTGQEIKLLCSAFRTKSYTPNMNPKTYFSDIINDNIMFNELFTQLPEDENNFKTKIDKLTSFQCYFLLHLMSSYFNSNDEGVPGFGFNENPYSKTYDKYFSFLLKEK